MRELSQTRQVVSKVEKIAIKEIQFLQERVINEDLL